MTIDYTKYGASKAIHSTASTTDVGLRTYMISVYKYMALALLLTGLVAYGIGTSETLSFALFSSPLSIVFMLAPIGMVVYMSVKATKLSTEAAQMCFWIYSALMGVSMATIFITYTSESITKVFFVTAATFGAMGIYGYTTKKDLTGIGSFMMMGLFGIIIASLVNIFMKSEAISFVISILGVVIFTGLTAYDVQRIKDTYYTVSGNPENAKKVAIYGALSLYLDFINLFISLLRLMGDRR